MVLIYVNIASLLFLIIIKYLIKLWTWFKYLFFKYIKPFLTWRILIIYIPIWFIVSGWSMVGIAIGHGAFRATAIAWQAFLWMPWCPEKLVTIPLTIWLHTKIFPNHSVGSLHKILNTEKEKNKTNKFVLFFQKIFKKRK